MLFSYISIVGSEIVLLVTGRKFDVESGMYFKLEYIEIGFCGMLQKTNITLKNVQKFKSIVMVTLENKNLIFIYRRNFS